MPGPISVRLLAQNCDRRMKENNACIVKYDNFDTTRFTSKNYTEYIVNQTSLIETSSSLPLLFVIRKGTASLGDLGEVRLLQTEYQTQSRFPRVLSKYSKSGWANMNDAGKSWGSSGTYAETRASESVEKSNSHPRRGNFLAERFPKIHANGRWLGNRIPLSGQE
ncbi:hypothetical protein BCR34DRAFT_588568 [Clohesyomyces aquaticus]|uniref:Uncharacterized protein n=1 Tax=Clohesyomyces aquaticus TaxID=1231657 RepID=A0A1Y1ZJQ8_9PLEO|nr:hypothetical protein BCR34DRAFT_588568 [Clohesyomyces aquaticus]